MSHARFSGHSSARRLWNSGPWQTVSWIGMELRVMCLLFLLFVINWLPVKQHGDLQPDCAMGPTHRTVWPQTVLQASGERFAQGRRGRWLCLHFRSQGRCTNCLHQEASGAFPLSSLQSSAVWPLPSGIGCWALDLQRCIDEDCLQHISGHRWGFY